MAVVIDPLRLDLHHRRQERAGPERRIVGGFSARHHLIPLVRPMVLTGNISFATVFSSMSRKSMPSGHDPMGGYRFSEKIMLKQ